MRTYLMGLTVALVAAGGNPAFAQSNPPELPMQFGQRLQLGPMMGSRIVREVMIGPEGSVSLFYDMLPGAPESRRVLRLENRNGMLEVIYDNVMPGSMALASGGTPRLVASGSGMYSVEYDR
jgi:hypothetical protein